MLDGALNLTLSRETTDRLAVKARALGIAPEVLATRVLDEALFRDLPMTWIGDDPATTPPAQPSQTGSVFELEDVLAEFDAELERRLASKA